MHTPFPILKNGIAGHIKITCHKRYKIIPSKRIFIPN